MDLSRIEIRPWRDGDDLQALTALLNRAYAPLAAAGMNFTAATQTPQQTAERIAAGTCLVALEAGSGRLLGSIHVARPVDARVQPWAAEARWICAPDIAHINQFAVEPGLQRAGIGARLMQAAEAEGRRRGAARLVLDTAEPAAHLRRWYTQLGYTEIGVQQWPGKAYRSVVMQKPVPRAPLATQLMTMARYNAWATRELFQHVDALPEADYRRDAGLFFKSVHGTLNHLLVGEHLLWRRRFADGVSPVLALDAEAEADRTALRRRLIEGAESWPALLDGWDSAQFEGLLRYRTTKGVEMALPFAATLAHVFNHGTHHRGQITAVLTAMGHTAPEIDLVWMLQRESARPPSGAAH